MPPELFDTAAGALRLAVIFFTALALPVMLQVLLLFGAGIALLGLAGLAARTIVTLLSLVGTPVHELAHALASLLTLSRVAVVKLHSDEVEVGFVGSQRSNPLGEIFISLAPTFFGVLVMWLAAVYIIPGFEAPAVPSPQLDLESAASFGAVFREITDFLIQFLLATYEKLFDLQWDNWRTYVGLYVVLSVGIRIVPSAADLKGLLGGLPLAALLIFALFIWLYVSGDALAAFETLQEALWPPLLRFATAITTAFALASLGILIFLPLGLRQYARKAREGME
jgi:hypothetical protein